MIKVLWTVGRGNMIDILLSVGGNWLRLLRDDWIQM